VPSLPTAVELSQVYEEARDIADRVQQTLSTAHVLLAMFTLPNHAQVLLADRKITEDSILAVIRRGDEDLPHAVRDLKEKTNTLGLTTGSRDVNCLHLLLAMTRMRGTAAYSLLTRSGEDLTELRTRAMGYLTGRMPRRYANFRTTSALRQEREPLAPAPPPPPPVMEKKVVKVETQQLVEKKVLVPPTPAVKKPVVKDPGALDSGEFPLLTSLGRDLTLLARSGKVDAMVGRGPELDRMIDILGKRRANNPCLVGEPGVGKTALVEGLAHRLVHDDDNLTGFADVHIVELDTGSLVAGTALRGSFNERMQGLKEELRRSDGRVIVFIDEVHTLIGAGGSGDGGLDAGNELKAALARGEFPCIGATTAAEYKKHIEKDAALARRFVSVTIEEPDEDEALRILTGSAAGYEEHHDVKYDTSALHAAVQLSARFITDRCLPGKAVDVMDLAGSRARRSAKSVVQREDVARVVSELAAIPLDRLLNEDQVRFLHTEEFLQERIVGHRDVIRTVAESIRRSYAGFAGKRPMASFMFLGPTGVGKTEMVKTLADFLFGSAESMVRLDMSEYSEGHAVSRLFGAPPGYVGHDEGGQLTDAIRRRPFSIVLLDEVEKAHGDVLLTLLQVLDEGRMTDGKGRVINFRNTVIIMTSNLGSEAFGSKGAMGFSRPTADAPNQASQHLLEIARKSMPPELWGRIDEKIVFEPLQRADVEQIARALLKESSERLRRERNITFTASDAVVVHLMDNGGYHASLGARPMRQAVQRLVESAVADAILAGRVNNGDAVSVGVEQGAVRVSRLEQQSAPGEATVVAYEGRRHGGTQDG